MPIPEGGFRKRSVYSQQALGEAVGVTKETIANWESDGIPGAEVIRVLVRVLGVSADWLIGIADEVEPDATVTEALGEAPAIESDLGSQEVGGLNG